MKLMKQNLRISADRNADFYHLYYYFSKERRIDGIRKAILDFKNDKETTVRRLILEALDELQYLDLSYKYLIIRALSHSEMDMGDMEHGSLDRLGESFAAVFECCYNPYAIFKKRETVSVKDLAPQERYSALKEIYGLKTSEFNDYKKVMILDDIVTTGATARAIAAPILARYPKTEIIFFALAWTPTAKQQQYLLGQSLHSSLLNEPEMQYGNRSEWFDTDYESEETYISVHQKV